MGSSTIFTQEFLITLRSLVGVHHSIYATIPPQGIFFEALVEKAFKQVRQPFTRVKTTTPNVPKHDLVVGEVRVSLKSETGFGTDQNFIQITKLCTTERDPWTPESLINHVIQHLSRYDYILMLRAIWEIPVIHYQLVEIPVKLLRRIEGVELIPVGRHSGRKSLGGDVYHQDRKIFHVHFDGADGKCQIRGLAISDCQLLFPWDLQIRD